MDAPDKVIVSSRTTGVTDSVLIGLINLGLSLVVVDGVVQVRVKTTLKEVEGCVTEVVYNDGKMEAFVVTDSRDRREWVFTSPPNDLTDSGWGGVIKAAHDNCRRIKVIWEPADASDPANNRNITRIIMLERSCCAEGKPCTEPKNGTGPVGALRT